jgi:N-acetylglutamate synthase-like GNAT family acetyltransferase
MAAEDRSGELREAAVHRGLKLVKSRRRRPGAGDFGRFGLTDADGKKLLGFGADGLTATADDIAAYLREGAAATWAESARATPPRPKRPAEKTPSRKADPEPLRAAKSKPKVAENPRTKSEAGSSPPPVLVVRNAKPGDAEAIAALIGGGKAIATLLRGRTPVLVADRGGVIGCVAWHVVPTLQHGAIGRITIVAVSEKERRQRIGTGLMQAARAQLAKRGCALIEVMSDIELRNAHGFFRALGFKQSSYRFTTD